MKTHLILSAPLTGLALLSACSPQKEEAKKPLNIVYIMTDDHTQQMMSCYDSRFAHTPNLDRLAKSGVRFTNSFVCNSISGPSRAVLLTGKHSHKNGKIDNEAVFDGDQQTVQKLLQQAGYQTALVGKWHLESTPTGFDYWKILPGQGDYYNPRFITPQGTEDYDGYVTNIISDISLDWMETKREKEKPFCLFIHHKAIHRNWMGDTTHLAMFEDREFELPVNFYDDYEGRPAAAAQEMSIDKDMDLIYDLKMYREGEKSRLQSLFTRKDGTQGTYGRMNAEQKAAWDRHYLPIIEEFYRNKPTGRELAEWKYQRYMRDYLKTVHSLDENVGRILDYLEKENLMDNTLIVYTSDQGFYMGEHGWFDKRFMYEESMRTPLVMHLPAGYDKRGDIPQLVQNIDYTPTFLDLAGVDIPEDIQGVSLLPLLKEGEITDWRTSLYYHYYEYPAEHAVKRHYGVRTGQYKLMHFYNDINVWELYDLQADPMEMNNLFGQEGYKEITDTLKTELARLQEVYDDPIRHRAQ
ncbi:arylsulfatase A-like enzyme [Parabacteroides sp. PM5-20]|uniref:sulfatase family protein n=1 Tax=unclassified Parabacteroides TaxID=2649774 RepID=UPI0013D836AD|nr:MULTISPECIES: sulfatase [unclassified Parabacteroides]MDH6534104.1 arylsulfatase A-like enzyme [Parabacteroides sp. PM5-20]